MKKLLVAVLAFALFAPAFAVENVKVTGDIQTIGLAYENHGVFPAPVDNLKGTTNRVLFGLEADLVEDVQAKLTFAHRNVFGMNALAGYPAPYTTGESLDDVWANTRVAEAFVKISNVFDALEVKVGRQYYGDVKSAVMYFGPDYGYAIVNGYASLDGATVRYNGENFALTAAYFSLANNITAPAVYPTRGEDMNLGGLDLDVKINENIKATAYIYEFENEATATLPAGVTHFGFWGVKPTIEYEHFKLGAEYTRNYSLGNDKGWQVKADLALPMGTDDTQITPRVTYLKSEKNFAAFGNYRPGLMFGTVLVAQGVPGAINNILGGALANWEILNAGVCMKFASLEKVGFGLDYYTGETDGVWQGNSWEAKVVYNHNEYVALNLTGAILTNAGHSWKHSPTAVQLGMNIKF